MVLKYNVIIAELLYYNSLLDIIHCIGTLTTMRESWSVYPLNYREMNSVSDKSESVN